MNAKTLVILLVFLTLSGIAFYLTRDQVGVDVPDNSDHASADLEGRTIVPENMLTSSLSRIGINDPDEYGALTIDRSDGKWTLLSPHQFPARTQAIDELLQLLAGLEGVEIDESHDPLGHAVGLVTSNHDEVLLTLGPRLGGGRAVVFIKRSGETRTYNASNSLHDYLLGLDFKTFCARKPPRLLMPDIRTVRIETPGDSSILHQVDGTWWIGDGTRAERALEQAIPNHPGVSSYFALFESIEVLDVQTYSDREELAKFGLDKPLISARFTPISQNNPEWGWQLNVGTPAQPQDQTRFVSFGWFDDPIPAVFTVATPIALAFAQDAEAFRDPRVIAMPVAMIESMMLRFADGDESRIDLANGKVPLLDAVRGEQRELSVVRTAEQLKRIADARAQGYVPIDSTSHHTLVAVTLKPRLLDDDESFTICVDPESKADKPTVLIQRGKESIALRVPKEAVAGLLDPESLVAPPR